MKTLLLIVILVLSLGETTVCQNLNNTIEEIRRQLAPDKRTAIFSVEASQIENKVLLKGEVSDPLYKENLIKVLETQTEMEIIDSVDVLPSKKLGNRTYAIVNLSVCNIRSKADHSAELSTQALMGTPLKVYKESDGWYLVQTPDEYLGWVDEDAINLKSKNDMIDWLKNKKVIYCEFFGFAFKDENFNEVVSDLILGDILELVNQSENYFKVRFPDGRLGFIKKNEAENLDKWFSRLTFDYTSIIEIGKKMIGFPYLWGGTSVKGVDCSGFMKTIYFINGIILPRDANQQALVGDEVKLDQEFSNLQPGDLIFFGRRGNNKRPEKISHVGIYLGNKKFLHSSGRVRIDSFDKKDENYNEYRLNTIVKIKRILGKKELIEGLKIINNKFYTEDFYK